MNDFLTTYPFASITEARAAAGKAFGKTVGAFGGRRDGIDRYQLRKLDATEVEVRRVPKVAKQACDSRKTSAKAICVKLFRAHSTDRDAFTAAAIARGIKPLTINTLWNDIRAGRVA
jgi:hypothetical protein